MGQGGPGPSRAAQVPLRRFPFADRPRLWGVALSHYQVEGDDRCDWTEWEAAGKAAEPCGQAVGSWTRYEEDAQLAAALGADIAVRPGLSGSQIVLRIPMRTEARA
jgi:beta-glucosidase/6-phospho-beta-glucosidase/beta-galactosidase